MRPDTSGSMKKQVPNALTYSRILVIPAFILAFYAKGTLGHWLSAAIFLFACITDFFDGYFARVWAAQSNVGRFLDPIADKLLVATALLLLVGADRVGPWGVLPAIAIVCREILVSGLREFLAELRISVPVSNLAKLKTGIQMAAIFLLLVGISGPAWLHADQLGSLFLWAAALLTLVTGYAYLRTSFKHVD